MEKATGTTNLIQTNMSIQGKLWMHLLSVAGILDKYT